MIRKKSVIKIKMPKSKKPKQPDGSLPDYVVNHITENTVGGFVCFYFNQETGQPEQAMSFDSPAHALALQKYIADMTEAIHQVTLDNSINSIQQAFGGKNEDGDSEKSWQFTINIVR